MESMTYKELYESYPNQIVVAEVVKRRGADGSGFAEKYAVLKSCISKTEAEMVLEFFESIGSDVILIPTFEKAIKLVVENEEIKEVGELVSPADYAKFWRTYFNMKS